MTFFNEYNMFIKTLILLCLSLCFKININANELLEYCEKSSENEKCNEKCEDHKSYFPAKRYILYDVNPSEGFNLRRDVYVRVATFVKKLSEDRQYQWHLVLPPWGNLYHWRSTDIGSQKQIPWGTFFDIKSLKKYIPVQEMYEFIKEYPSHYGVSIIDNVYFLRNDEEMFKIGKFKDKNIRTDCPQTGVSYKTQKDGQYSGFYWGYTNVTARKVECIIFHGTIYDLKINLKPNLYRSIMFYHMEIPLHYSYGSSDYWKARRSMRYNSELYEIASEFRLIYLNSNDLNDKTRKHEDWRLDKKKQNAIGGPYLAVHFRRRDFLIVHRESSPTVENAASQIIRTMKLLNLDAVYVATDTDEKEYIQLKNKLTDYSVFHFIPSKYVKEKFKDGGIAIIDQIICSHARYFIGTHESTFSFRIQEDREILGFSAITTFNRLCTTEKNCSSGGGWEIAWD